MRNLSWERIARPASAPELSPAPKVEKYLWNSKIFCVFRLKITISRPNTGNRCSGCGPSHSATLKTGVRGLKLAEIERWSGLFGDVALHGGVALRR